MNTDRHDARGIAHIMRTGWYRDVHVKSIDRLELVGALIEERARPQDKHSPEITRYVVATLSALIDQLVDWNCRLSMWISQNQQVGRAFCGPGVPMRWDYVETDPVLSGPANLWDKLDRIVAGVCATPAFAKRPIVCQGAAQSLLFPRDTFDAVITDPPYYDNVFYNVLADFFYAWKRPVLKNLCPELFGAHQCGEDAELVASQFRHGDHGTARAWYCTQLAQCLQEVTRVLKPEGILSFVFAHSSLWGWEAIVQGFRRSGLVLTSAEPLSIERRQRPRAMTSEAVNVHCSCGPEIEGADFGHRYRSRGEERQNFRQHNDAATAGVRLARRRHRHGYFRSRRRRACECFSRDGRIIRCRRS